MRWLNGLREVAGEYDAFIIDLWGVIHNGIEPYPGALEVLRNLQNRPVLLLSNAPRRAHAAQSMLRAMNIPDSLYTHILTSGEATWRALHDRTNPWFARLGTHVYHLGPLRDRNVLDGLALTIVPSPAEADFILNTGPDDDTRDPTTLDNFLPELKQSLSANLPMICANPDRIVMKGTRRLLCAGALADWYRGEGGDVFSLGKPDGAIYDMALGLLESSNARILAIGDSLHTDIAGAAGARLDSLWILGGIHGEIAASRQFAESLAHQEGAVPDYIMPLLGWR